MTKHTGLQKPDHIIWVDVESNGLDENEHQLLQVAALVTDGDFNVVSELFEGKVFYTAEESVMLRNSAIPFVQEMHDSTGLWGDLTAEGVPVEVLDAKLLAFLSDHVAEPFTAPLGGNSITLDRNFLRKFLPKSFAHIHYQSFDMSSVDAFIRATFPNVPAKPALAIGDAHNAASDIMASINQAKMLKDFMKHL